MARTKNCGRCLKPKSECNCGRPTVMTPEVIGKLEQAFSFDTSIDEACLYAGIHPDTYYAFVKKNPKYSDHFKELRNHPVLKARKSIVDKLEDPINAKWYLERKRKNEFGERRELTGLNGGAIQITGMEIIKDNEDTVQNQEPKTTTSE